MLRVLSIQQITSAPPLQRCPVLDQVWTAVRVPIQLFGRRSRRAMAGYGGLAVVLPWGLWVLLLMLLSSLSFLNCFLGSIDFV